ncbi:MAG: translocation/assembly module TamB domain-containing protein [Opitutaceae bacterium]|nr:translocation/assembly module TamB domain-containing protein [Opitutaceae bacterium]
MNPAPTSPPRRRRLWRRLVVGAVAAVGVGAVTLPWWLPPLVVRVAARQGVTIGSWETHGWHGATYRDIRFARDGVEVGVDEARAPVLLVFPRGRTPVPAGPRLTVGQVDVRVAAGPRPAPAEPPGAAGLIRRVDELWTTLDAWLPNARVGRATIVAGAESCVLESLIWDGASLQGTARMPGRKIDGVASIVRSMPGHFAVHARVPDREATAEATITLPEHAGATIRGRLTWRGNPFEVSAEFGPTGRLPDRATLLADAVSVPSSDLGLTGYGPAQGRVEAQWSRTAFTLAVSARAEPERGSDWPAIAVDVRASGDLERVRIESIQVDLPRWRAALSQPVEYVLARGLAGEPAEFAFEGELAAIPALEARGRVSGRAKVRPTAGGEAEVEFSLGGDGLAWRELEPIQLALAGAWRGDEVVVDSAVVDLGGENRSEASFTIDFGGREVREAHVRAVVPAIAWRVAAPDLPTCERIELEASVEGPWASPRHRGSMRIQDLEWTSGRRVSGRASWSGEGVQVAADGELGLAGGGTLPFAVSGRRDADGALRGSIEQLRWVDAEGEWWHLAEPVIARLEPALRMVEVAPWRLEGDGLEIAGEARLRWPSVGEVDFVVRGLEGRRFGGVLPEAIRGGRIESLQVRAAWDHGPARIEGTARATYTPVAGAVYAVEADFVTQMGDLALGSVRVADASGVVLRGTGRVPLEIIGSDAGFHAALRRDGAISLELKSEPNPVFWKSIADLTGWSVEEPRLDCRLTGSLGAPRGEATFAAATVRPPPMTAAGGQLPDLAGLKLTVAADDAGLAITEGMVAVDDRWVTLTGRAPWEVWSTWRETGSVAWRGATFELASNPLPIAIASRIFPTELAPVGEVSIKVAHAPGDGLSGRIWLHDAALRPIGPLGSVREVNSELDFAGYVVTLNGLEGLLGGQPMKLTGQADLSEPGHTAFGLRLTSSRVPLVRRAGLIVRTELDLELRKLPKLPARVTGRVDFGPSLYRADLLELMPSGVDSPSTRPPYFSIEEKPFADWQLDVAVHGEGFLQLITPFYKDVLSTDLRLTGTLAEPRAEGWVWGTGGVVIFPFGSLPVEQVLVTLTRDNPYEPRLVVSGEGRVMGYDIRMEASGPASEPRLLFTSDPPLTSQQVFLMLTTGAVPDESHTIGSSDRASRLAMFLGRNLAAGLGLGGGAGGDERLSIRSGEDFTREGRETISVQYDLDGRWSIVGEYDRFDAYNGGIKFRLINR